MAEDTPNPSSEEAQEASFKPLTPSTGEEAKIILPGSGRINPVASTPTKPPKSTAESAPDDSPQASSEILPPVPLSRPEYPQPQISSVPTPSDGLTVKPPQSPSPIPSDSVSEIIPQDRAESIPGILVDSGSLFSADDSSGVASGTNPDGLLGAEGSGKTTGSSAASLSINQRLGKYHLNRLLGTGGMGEVYEATDVILDRKVALKVLPDRLAGNEKSIKRFLREARAAAQLNHPNAVAIYDVARNGEITYITMEMIVGSTAQEALEKNGPMSPEKATAIIAAACRGLAAAHRVGLIHRDVKPANILLSDDGSVKVSDFGLAKSADPAIDLTTQENALLGTPGYMSPEQCEGRPTDARSDIYALGCTYFALLTGKPPYQRDSVMKTLYAHCHAEIPDPRERISGLPEACAQITAKAMAKNPEDRYPAVDNLLDDLERAFGSALVSGLPSGRTPGTIIMAPGTISGMADSGTKSGGGSSGAGSSGGPSSGGASPDRKPSSSGGSWAAKPASPGSDATVIMPNIPKEDSSKAIEHSRQAKLVAGVSAAVALVALTLLLGVIWWLTVQGSGVHPTVIHVSSPGPTTQPVIIASTSQPVDARPVILPPSVDMTLVLQPGPTDGQDICIGQYENKPAVPSDPDWQESPIGAWTAEGMPFAFRSYIKFAKLAQIPATAQVISAKLFLTGVNSSILGPQGNSSYPDSTHNSVDGNTCQVQRIIGGDWNMETLTFNNQPESTGVDVAFIPASSKQWNYDATLNVTSMVKAMVAEPSKNYGFMIKLSNESPYRWINFLNSRSTNQAGRPKLVVVYRNTANAEPPPKPAVDTPQDTADKIKAFVAANTNHAPPIVVDLHDSSITDEGLKALKDLNGLTSLILNNTHISDRGIKELTGLPNLTSLYLVNTHIGDGALVDIAAIPNLQTLDLGQTQISETGIRNLKNAKNLSRLGLNNTNAQDSWIDALKDLKNLKAIWLNETKFTPAGEAALQQAMPDLQLN